MNIHVHGGRAGACRAAEDNHVTLVVDALRASATTASLLHYGVKRIIVVETVEQAFAEHARRPGSLLVGERGCLKVPGFDLGNSPLRDAAPALRPEVVFSSSNMSRCCVGAAAAPAVFLAATVTATAAARLALREATALATDVTLVPAGAAGDEERFVLEDYIAAGGIIARLLRLSGGQAQVVGDGAHAAWELYRLAEERGLEGAFLATDNGVFLTANGFGDDVRFASREDIFTAVPRVVSTHALPDNGIAAVLENRGTPSAFP